MTRSLSRLAVALRRLVPRSRRRAVVWVTLAAAAAAGLAASVPGSASGLVTTSGGAFTISGTLSGMKPGLATNLSLTISNPQKTPLYLQSVSASLVSAVYTGTSTAAPVACAGYLSPVLSHTWTAWSGPTTIPAASGTSSPGSAVVTVPLSFTDSVTNQNSCENVTFNLSYSGSGYYSDPTTTALAGTPNPANIGAPVTLTATVSPTYSGTAPTGTVTFTGPSGALAGSPVTLSASGTASLSTSTLAVGSSSITAIYTPTVAGTGGGPNFLGSSATTSESVVGGCVSAPTSAATTIITSTYNGNYTVASGKSVWLDGGTITGNVVVNPGGQFTATGGKIGASVTVGGNTSIQGTTIAGNVVSLNTALSLGYGTKVAGVVQAAVGGPVCINAATVGGNLQLTGLTSGALASICGTTAPSVEVQNNGEPVQIGGSATCAGNVFSGNLVVQSDSGKVTVGAPGFGNTASVGIEVENNTGGGTLAANGTTGVCLLQNDSPGIVGSANTVPSGHVNTCNRTG